MAAGRKNRSAGMPMRNIRMLMTANRAPAKPPPPGIFDTLIWGLGVPSPILHLLIPGYLEFNPATLAMQA
jgi:hypothetical protein